MLLTLQPSTNLPYTGPCFCVYCQVARAKSMDTPLAKFACLSCFSSACPKSENHNNDCQKGEGKENGQA